MPRHNSRDAVIAAARELIESDGFAAASVSAVAAAAGVSRQTIYSLFGSREDLVSQTVIAALAEVSAKATAAAAATDGAVEYMVELIVASRRESLRQPIFRALLRAERNNPLLDPGMMERTLPVIAAQLAPVRDRDPALADPKSFEQLTELVTRLGMSIVVFDSPVCRDERELRAFLARCLSGNLTVSP